MRGAFGGGKRAVARQQLLAEARKGGGEDGGRLGREGGEREGDSWAGRPWRTRRGAKGERCLESGRLRGAGLEPWAPCMRWRLSRVLAASVVHGICWEGAFGAAQCHIAAMGRFPLRRSVATSDSDSPRPRPSHGPRPC
jgi:hypothetical protein